MDFSVNLQFYLVLGAILVTPLLLAVSGLVCAVRGWRRNRSRTAGIFVSVVAAYLVVGFCIIAIGYAFGVIHRGDAWAGAFIWPVVVLAFVLGWGA